ncbi:MAG: alpha/beta hydrolase [Gemmatimonadaceae bacterium]|jgi:dipeptidyl aminopeptidase/acylaminoacyl peptidase|nr:alpha/beta hydrolase [Gemmatimonadaceae bacterium]
MRNAFTRSALLCIGLLAPVACDAPPSTPREPLIVEPIADARSWVLLSRDGDTLARETVAERATWVHATRVWTATGRTERLTFTTNARVAQWTFTDERAAPVPQVRMRRAIAHETGWWLLTGAPIGDVVQVDTIASARPLWPWLDASGLLLERLARRAADGVPVVALNAPRGLETVHVRASERGTMHVAHDNGTTWRVRLDTAGALLDATERTRGLRLQRVEHPMRRASASPIGPAIRDTITACEVDVVMDDGVRLRGTLTLPATDSARPVPVVLFVSGDGPQSRDLSVPTFAGYAPFAELADTLARSGIGSLRLDDRGTGASEGAAFAQDADADLRDVRAALSWLRTQPVVHAEALGVIAHSDGGLLALELGAIAREAFAAIVTLGTPSHSGATLAAHQRQAIARDAPLAPVTALARVDPWLRAWLARDPRTRLGAVSAAVLLVHGAADGQVAPAEADTLAALLRARGATRVTVRRLAAVDHLLLDDADGDPRRYAQLPSRRVAPSVIATIVPWLRATLRTDFHPLVGTSSGRPRHRAGVP